MSFDYEIKQRRSPAWNRDELILALDLYFKLNDPIKVGDANPEVITLSMILNTLPLEENKDYHNYRNPNSVKMKLHNFVAIDPNQPGRGLQGYGRLDKEVWDEFSKDQDLLRKIATSIKRNSSNKDFIKRSPLQHRIVYEEEEEPLFPEGAILYRIHRVRERNQSVVKDAKDAYSNKHGKLSCQVCGFNFAAIYGPLGEGFIECHHVIPVCELDPLQATKIKDLALICSNCHRMIHRYRLGFPRLIRHQVKHFFFDFRSIPGSYFQ